MIEDMILELINSANTMMKEITKIEQQKCMAILTSILIISKYTNVKDYSLLDVVNSALNGFDIGWYFNENFEVKLINKKSDCNNKDKGIFSK